MGPNGLVPTLIVFGSLPSLLVANKGNMAQKERQDALRSAREEIYTITVEKRIRTQIETKIPPAKRL